jgi:hypothetical protein
VRVATTVGGATGVAVILDCAGAAGVGTGAVSPGRFSVRRVVGTCVAAIVGLDVGGKVGSGVSVALAPGSG